MHYVVSYVGIPDMKATDRVQRRYQEVSTELLESPEIYAALLCGVERSTGHVVEIIGKAVAQS